MDRRKFLKGSSLLTGLFALNPLDLLQAKDTSKPLFPIKNAKNIIFMVSDGMSNGTLSMTDIYSRNILGKTSEWMSLYHENKVSRALMDTASANSIVTDSSAASSSFGSGHGITDKTNTIIDILITLALVIVFFGVTILLLRKYENELQRGGAYSEFQ